jgi:HD-GYP domain-containing protein (c-di-GMP phosphodiesterase class II)
MLPLTSPFANVVQESQTPWQRLQSLQAGIKAPQQIAQIVHLADAVSLLLDDSLPVLNQVGQIRAMIHSSNEEEFSPEVLAAFDDLCEHESVWMDLMYRPQFFLDLITDNRWISLDETVKQTQFMSKIIDFRSPFTAMHSAGVAATATALAELAGMSEDECKMMRIAGYLHDIGKLRIPDEILEKPGKLTDEEFNVMKEHAYYTWIILKDVKGFEQITSWAALHHEKLNGTGYPFHLSDSELPLGSRIMTVADIFSALAEDRPYRKSMEKEKVIDILRGDAEKGLLSASIVRLLTDNYEPINKRRASESRSASRKYQEILAGK